MLIVGHDPGCTGGLILTHNGEEISHMLLSRGEDKRIDALEVYDWLVGCGADIMISEKVGSFRGDTPMTAWRFGGAESAVISAAKIADLPVVYAPIDKWQKAIFVVGGFPHATYEERISSAFAFAREQHPALAHVLRLKKNDGLAAAACIAEYGWRLHQHGRLLEL